MKNSCYATLSDSVLEKNAASPVKYQYIIRLHKISRDEVVPYMVSMLFGLADDSSCSTHAFVRPYNGKASWADSKDS